MPSTCGECRFRWSPKPGLTLAISLALGLCGCSRSCGAGNGHSVSMPSGPSAFATGTSSQETRASAASSDPAEKDFEVRCHAPGVSLCLGFDSPEDFRPATWPGSGLYPDWKGSFRGTFDTHIKASGTGSLRFEIPPNAPANGSGFWRQSMLRSFGARSTYYVQFRQRFSPQMIANIYGHNVMWKQAIFHGPDSTCADVSLVTQAFYSANIPHLYTDCGQRGIFTNGGHPPYLIQQGDYKCWYGDTESKSCFHYVPNEWLTFYYEVSIGDWGRPNSSIKAWVAREGKPYRQWINIQNFTLHNASPGKNDYSYVDLLPYMTGRDPSVNGGPTAYTWYEELIISAQPIAAPQ